MAKERHETCLPCSLSLGSEASFVFYEWGFSCFTEAMWFKTVLVSRLIEGYKILRNSRLIEGRKIIFSNSIGARGIAATLTSEGVRNPTTYKYESGILKKPRPAGTTYYWHPSTITGILDSQEYLGNTVNFKTYSKSYKDKKSRKNAPENQMVFENTHPAIIEKPVWDIVRKMREHKRRPPVYGMPGLFSGLAYCSDCDA